MCDRQGEGLILCNDVPCSTAQNVEAYSLAEEIRRVERVTSDSRAPSLRPDTWMLSIESIYIYMRNPLSAVVVVHSLSLFVLLIEKTLGFVQVDLQGGETRQDGSDVDLSN